MSCEDYCIVKGTENPVAYNNEDKSIYSITKRRHDRSRCLGDLFEGNFIPLPNIKKERECIYISGPSGAGKTWSAMKYIGLYTKFFPNRKIYIFSNKKLPWTLKNEIYVKPTNRFFNRFKLKDFKDSLFLFDDLENLVREKEMERKIMKLIEEILNVGRTFHISIVLITHVMMNYRFTKNIINECNKVIMYPRSGSKQNYVNFLKRYVGFSRSMVADILRTDSRWLVLDKECPMNVVTRHKIRLLS